MFFLLLKSRGYFNKKIRVITSNVTTRPQTGARQNFQSTLESVPEPQIPENDILTSVSRPQTTQRPFLNVLSEESFDLGESISSRPHITADRDRPWTAVSRPVTGKSRNRGLTPVEGDLPGMTTPITRPATVIRYCNHKS